MQSLGDRQQFTVPRKCNWNTEKIRKVLFRALIYTVFCIFFLFLEKRYFLWISDKFHRAVNCTLSPKLCTFSLSAFAAQLHIFMTSSKQHINQSKRLCEDFWWEFTRKYYRILSIHTIHYGKEKNHYT